MSEPVFYGDLMNCWKSLILVINSKRLLNVIKEWDTTRISCDSLHAWLLAQSRFIAMLSSLIAQRWVSLILNEGPDIKLESAGWYLMLAVGRAHCSST